MRPSRWCGTVLVAVFAAACSPGATSLGKAQEPTSSVGTPVATKSSTTSTRGGPTSTTTSPRAHSAINVRPVAQVRVGSAPGPLLNLFGHRVALPAAEPRSGREDQRVVVIDIRTGKESTVARTQWRQGLINWAVGSGRWVAWVDQSRRQSDFSFNVLWRVWAKNLRTNERRLLASNADIPDPFVPQVVSGDGYIFWAQARKHLRAQEFAWKPGAAQPMRLSQAVNVATGTETASDGYLTYLGESASPRPRYSKGGDCWRVPITGGRPRALTHTGLAMGCAANDGWLVWSQHIDPYTAQPPADGIADDPYTYWAEFVAKPQPRRLHKGYTSSRYPVAGPGYGSWEPREAAFVVHSVTSNAKVFLAPNGVGGLPSSSASGHLFAYTTTHHPRVIRVVHITVH